MYLTGFTDEAASDIEKQIEVCRILGWEWIELRSVDGENIVNLPEEKFERICEKLEDAEIRVSCFESEIANWSRKITDSPERDYREMERAITRMKRMGTDKIRIMSYAVPENIRVSEKEIEEEVIGRLAELVRIAENGGVICLHENCETWGGRSYEHTLRLIDAIDSPSFRLVFDTGNPFTIKDIRGEPPYSYQDALEFFRNVRAYIDYVHIKDGIIKNGKVEYTYPAEGCSHVTEIIGELFKSGYKGGFSIEPHMAVVFHDPDITSSDEYKWSTFIEYGRRTEKLLREAGYRW